MNLDRRQLALPVLAIGLLAAAPAFAGADEDAVAKNVEAFRAAHDGFEAFVGDDPTMDAKSNAPTTMTMN